MKLVLETRGWGEEGGQRPVELVHVLVTHCYYCLLCSLCEMEANPPSPKLELVFSKVKLAKYRQQKKDIFAPNPK